MVLGRRGGIVHRSELERAGAALPELRADACRDAGCLGSARDLGALLHRPLARPYLPRHHRFGRLLPRHAHRLRRRDLGEGAPRVLVRQGQVRQTRAHGRCRARRRTTHGGRAMNKILAVLAGGLLIGAFAAANAELPPPTPQEKAAAAAKAEKAAAEKAKDAKELARAQDRAVANWRKNKGASSTGTATQPASRQGSAAAPAPSAAQGAH